MENFNNDKGLQTMAHALIGRQDHIGIDNNYTHTRAHGHPHTRITHPRNITCEKWDLNPVGC